MGQVWIESKDYGKEKAKSYSVNSYVREKISFINRFKLDVQDPELKYMRDILESIPDYRDPYMESVVKLFYVLFGTTYQVKKVDLVEESRK